MTGGVTRFSISVPFRLAHDLDVMIGEKGYPNRSMAICDMIVAAVLEHRQQYAERKIAGTISIVYDHDRPKVQSTLTSLQHDHPHEVVSTLRVHLDKDNCLEVIVVRGEAKDVKRFADKVVTTKGVKHGKLTISSIEKELVS